MHSIQPAEKVDVALDFGWRSGSLDGQRWEISKALARERVRLVRTTDRILVYYCNSLLKEIDVLAQRLCTVERWTQPNCKGCPDNASLRMS